MVTTSEGGRALQTARRRLDKVCPVCGQVFSGLKRQTYCTKRCGNVAVYRRIGRADRRAQRPAGEGEP